MHMLSKYVHHWHVLFLCKSYNLILIHYRTRRNNINTPTKYFFTFQNNCLLIFKLARIVTFLWDINSIFLSLIPWTSRNNSYENLRPTGSLRCSGAGVVVRVALASWAMLVLSHTIYSSLFVNDTFIEGWQNNDKNGAFLVKIKDLDLF